MQNMTQTQNPQSLVIPANLPGYFMSRAQIAEWRDIDRKSRKESFLDDVGEMIVLDNETLYVVPAKALEYTSTLIQLRNLGLTRITKIVVSQDGGLLITATGNVPPSWIKTFSKFGLPKAAETDKHFVKCFAPTYQGSLVGYHTIRTTENRLNTKVFDQVNGLPIAGIDMVSHDGKINFAVVTQPTFPQGPLGFVFTREVKIDTLRTERDANIPFKTAPWAEGKNVQGLRGFIRGGKVTYTFLDTDKNALYMVSPTDNKVKQLKDNVRGLLNPVTGVQVVRDHMATIITNDKIVAMGQDDKVIADLNQPQYAELAQFLRGLPSYQLGIHGQRACYLANGGTPTAHLEVAKTEMNNAVA